MVILPWILSLALQASWVRAAAPLVDFDRMGKVGLAGAFAGLDLFNTSSLTFDPASSTLFSRKSDGSLTRIAVTNQQGKILAGCAIGDLFYFGGTFFSISDVEAQNVASYNTATGAISALGTGGPNGEVNALYCDGDKVWVGGQFTSPSSAVAIWDTKASSWSAPPFKGLRGASAQVLSISSADSSLFFAGSFIAPFGSPVAINGTNNPNVPFSAGATPYSSSLVPVPLSNVEVEGAPSTDESGFNDIKSILCPAGSDGPGNTWFARDGATAVVTIRTFSSLMASGVRLGNTFLGNHATTGFSVTTIPDNQVQTLSYVDPATGQNQTCSDPCPLGTDSAVLYQDFLFDSVQSITGVQIRLSQWNGQAPGLHIVQLLSSGAFASAIDGDNGASCFAPQASKATHVGEWSAKVANTNIAGTTQTVLVSSVNVGTSSGNGPSFTWYPYVSASGNYEVSLLVPGCNAFQDCALRTSVKVTVFPGNGLPPTVVEVSQRNENDAIRRLYSGPIVPTTPDFVATITMTLADDPEGNGQNGKYELVADRVQLVLTSANATTTGGPNTNGTISAGSQASFGFLEWSKSSNEQVDATSSLPNSTLTTADQAGIQIFRGLGNNVSANNNVSSVIHHPSGTKYLAGAFILSSGISNIGAFRDGNLVALPDNGLNGPVSSMVLVGDQLFVGGSFQDTPSGSQQGKLRGVAMYDIPSNTWRPLQAGVDGTVASLGFLDDQIQLAGDFDRILPSDGSSTGGIAVGGLAAWRVSTGTWVNPGGFVVGSLDMIANGTRSEQFVAGSIIASKKYGANGMVLLKNGGEEGPEVDPLSVQWDGTASSTNTTTTTTPRPSNPGRKRHAHSWVGRFTVPRLFSRQSPSQPSNGLPTLPTNAPAVLAGAFWSNSSSGHEIAILGGNFSFSGSQAVAFYDTQTETVSAPGGPQINGIVRSLLVMNDKLYIGGQFTLEGTNVNGLAIYNLASHQWENGSLTPLQAASGASVVVRTITRSESDPRSVVVAGLFAQAGDRACAAICKLDTSSMTWVTLGGGIEGEVSSVVYGGDKQNVLVAAGVITLSGASANVARYSFSNNTWSAVGDGSQLPGVVTAVEVNDGNSSSIFAAGRTTDGSSPFLAFWDGVTWTSQETTLQGNTTIMQLAMVPLQNTHEATGVIQRDRMLMISGALVDSSFGSASSALYDGQTFIPYVVSTSQDGSSGFVSSIFRSFSAFSFNQRRFLATGIVILISIAIAAGVVFLLALIGIIWTLLSRRDEKAAAVADPDEDDDSVHHRPSSLLEHINAATRSTILGASTSPVSQYNSDKEEEKIQDRSADHDPFVTETFQRAETPSEVFGHALADESGRVAHVRFSFDGSGEGELPLSAGAEVEILDDKDHAWWYARDPRTGREGVVPAAYLY